MHEVHDKTYGLAHHRKTRSRCSIDWALPPTDKLLENQEHLERIIRDDPKTASAYNDVKGVTGISCSLEPDPISEIFRSQSGSQSVNQNVSICSDETYSVAVPSSQSTCLPGVIDRLVALSRNKNKGRWFPYVYEVVVFQWEAILYEQSRFGIDKVADDVGAGKHHYGSECLCDMALVTRGWTIECAPTLFQIIKKSLGWRVDSIFRQQRDLFGDSINMSIPLVTLDKSFQCALENLIQMVADACIDSRNFDSVELLKTCLDVNDSIVKFLRDLFSMLDSCFVQRLLMIYFSRFNTVDGKLWMDHESKTGLQPSWEVFKMQLHAITLLTRFVDFTTVNKQMPTSWFTCPLNAPTSVSNAFFDKTLQKLMDQQLGVVAFSGPLQKSFSPRIPSNPYWLSNVVLQACTLTLSHSDDNIKIQGTSVIYELLCSLSHMGRLRRNSSEFGCMFFPLITMLIDHSEVISTLPTKGLIRSNVFTCLVFVLQSAPVGLMRALWRTLIKSNRGVSNSKHQFGRIDFASTIRQPDDICNKLEPSIFGLLNLCLKTLEYEYMENSVIVGCQRFLLTRSCDGLGHEEKIYTTDASRAWYSHDSSVVVINTCRLIVRETLSLARGPKNMDNDAMVSLKDKFNFSTDDYVSFTRFVSSVYLTCLSLNQSDLVYIKAIVASVEIVKVFGIEIFISAVGETINHWMRIILWLCAARRKEVRISTLDFLALLLRLSWDSFGSFSMIRIPSLSVITEVMDRLLLQATNKAVRNRKDLVYQSNNLPIECAEAALSPLWISLDRLHRKSSSRNVAFKAAVEHLGCSMKTLYRAFIASHAMLVTPNADLIQFSDIQLMQVSRIITASAGLSRQYLGNFILHKELIEEALYAASDEFSTAESPLDRIHFLSKLAILHHSYGAFAEEAFCRYEIYRTWVHVVKLCSKKIFSFPIPFLPWLTESQSTPRYIGDRNTEDIGNLHYSSTQRGIISQLIRERAAELNCIVGVGDRNLFYGVCPSNQYVSLPPVITMKEIEYEMVEEAERSGDCFRRSMLIENSRLMMNHATLYYTSIHDYEKLSYLYTKQAYTVSLECPTIDPNLLFEVSSEYGRFYRVWFHGNSLPDDLMGSEFIYRTENTVKLEEFSKYITQVVSSALSENTPIDILIDDRYPDEQRKQQPRRLAASLSREPVKIKITAIRPIITHDSGSGSSPWFYDVIQQPLNHKCSTSSSDTHEDFITTKINFRHRKNSRSSISSASFISRADRMDLETMAVNYPSWRNSLRDEGITGVRKFSFTQPLQKDRYIGSRNWFKASAHNFCEKNLRVTELVVGSNFPCCVTRQRVSYRSIYVQSPLEAGIYATCQWCSVLFRTIIAINGLTVTGNYNTHQGIGKDALKIVAECIHRSNVRDIAQLFLQRPPSATTSSDDERTPDTPSDRLSDDEIRSCQLKLARAVVLMMELLLLLIGRNRDILWKVIKDRKKESDSHILNAALSIGRMPSLGADVMRDISFDAISTASGMDQRTDSAIAVQRELQRSLISLVRSVIQPISEVLRDETPQWLALCCNEGYFSCRGYRQTNLLALGSDIKFVDDITPNHRKDEGIYLSRTMPISLSIPPVRSDDGSRRSISSQGSFADDSYHSHISRTSSSRR